MFDPKTMYQDRTPPPPMEAPRDALTRPRLSPPPAKEPPASVYMTSRYNGTCATCGCGFAKGAHIVWIRAERKTYHERCYTKAQRQFTEAADQ